MACGFMVATWVNFNALTAVQKTWLVTCSYEDSLGTIRSSLDGLEFIIKCCDSICICDVVGLAHIKYTHAQALVLVANADWLSTVGL